MNAIYALESPIDGKVYYVGQTMHVMSRPWYPYHHHNIQVKEWVKSLESEPVVRILERDVENLLDREKYWINKMLERKEPLLNIQIPTERQLKYADYKVGSFVKLQRKKCKLTQIEFADKAGVGLRFIRDLEQGKESCRLDKVLQVLHMFGANLVPVIK